MTSNKKLRIVKVQIPKDSMWQEALAREVASLYYLDIAWHQMIGRMESLTLPGKPRETMKCTPEIEDGDLK